MATSLTDLDLKKLLVFKPSFWDKLSQYVIKWIYADMRKGILQGLPILYKYRSKQYMKYKANFMRRFTKGGELKSFDPSQDYRGRRLYGKKKLIKSGNKLTGLTGQSVESNWTKSVNMLLTGTLIRGLHKESSTSTSLTMSYDEKDKDKIIGNRRYNRIVTSLNDANRVKVAKMLRDELKENLRGIFRGVITISIGKI